MQTRNQIALLALAAGALPVAALAQPAMVLIGPMGPSGMTPDGQTIVGSSNQGPARWHLSGGTPSFSNIPGSYTGSGGAVGCSNDGTILTGALLNTAGAGGLPTDKELAARWSGSAWQSLGVFPGANACDSTINGANGISSTGRFVVGGGWIDCHYRAFVWDANTGIMTNLGVLNPTASSRANCISTNGSLIAGFDESPLTGVRRPAIWLNGAESVLTTTGDPTTEGGEVYAMNDAGTLLLGSSFQYPNEVVLWAGAGNSWTQHSLGTIPAIPDWVYNFFFDPYIQSVTPTAMTQDGQVIVGSISYSEPGSFPVDGAFLYTPALGIVDLTTYLYDHGASGIGDFGLAGDAAAISADGRIIAGATLGIGGGAWAVYLDGTPCQPPTAWINNSLTNADVGGYAIFNCAVIGSPSIQYQWRRNGTPISNGDGPNGSSYSGATTSQLFVSNAQCENAGSFDCVATGPCGSSTAPAVALTVNGCSCYANCDSSTTAPILNINDFICFQSSFAAGESYANCDGSTTPPLLNINDFVCFQSRFAAGCP